MTMALVTDFHGHGHEGEPELGYVEDEDSGPQLRLVSLVRCPSRPPDAVLVRIAAAGVQSFSHPTD